MRLQKGRVLPFRATWASNSGRKHSPRSGMGKPAPFHIPRCMPATKNGTDPISSILMLTDAFEGVLISCGCMHRGRRRRHFHLGEPGTNAIWNFRFAPSKQDSLYIKAKTKNSTWQPCKIPTGKNPSTGDFFFPRDILS